MWLTKNNKWYKNIKISEENLSLYPEGGDITNMLKRFEISDCDLASENIEENSNSFVPDTFNLQQDNIIGHKLNLTYPSLGQKPIDEFQKNEYISKAFPVLFPTGSADFSDDHDDDDFFFIEYCKLSMLYIYKDSRFAKDFRLKYFLINTYFRHQVLSQTKIYIKQGN